ncbi:AarF/ABC1/UbiB kinase family protein [Soehngenia saccharolytica]|nr:AarF/ABC1/UbiB kinase family protein [Soehngenia saccharolytica]
MDNTKTTSRLREIISVFVKHGLNNGIQGFTDPYELRKAFEELGPTFVKIGQILSTRPDLIPSMYIEEFNKLQDNVKPEEFSELRSSIEEELNVNLEDIFIQISEIPLASASMAQVHLALLLTGEEVAVKIQRPGIKEKMLGDIYILKKISKFIRRVIPEDLVDIDNVIDELEKSAINELNFLIEAENMEKFRNYNKDVKYIYCPEVYKDYSTEKILTMGYVKGIKISDITTIDLEGYDLNDIAVKLVQNYMKQVLQDGFFHGDPHPGNLMIYKNKIAYLDFGIMGVLNNSLRRKFNALITAIALKDLDKMTDSVIRIGDFNPNIDRLILKKDISVIYDRYIESSLEEIELSQIMEEIFNVAKKNHIKMPKDMVVLSKSLLTIEGLVSILDPTITMMDIVIPYVQSRLMDSDNLKKEFKENLMESYFAYKAGLKIPVSLHKLIEKINNDDTKLGLNVKDLDEIMSETNRMVNRVVFAIIVSAIILSSSLILHRNIGPKIMDISILGLGGYLFAGILGFWLLISILKSGRM